MMEGRWWWREGDDGGKMAVEGRWRWREGGDGGKAAVFDATAVTASVIMICCHHLALKNLAETTKKNKKSVAEKAKANRKQKRDRDPETLID